MHEEPRIRLFINQHVPRRVGAQFVPIDEAWPMMLIQPHIEEMAAILRPHGIATGIPDDPVQILARLEIANMQIVIFRAMIICRPHQMTVIG